MKKIRLKENKKIERFKCDNSKMMQLAINSKNYHKKKLEEELLIQLNNLNNTLNKKKRQINKKQANAGNRNSKAFTPIGTNSKCSCFKKRTDIIHIKFNSLLMFHLKLDIFLQ